MKLQKLLSIILLAFIMSGCVSVFERSSNNGRYTYAYTGVRSDLDELSNKDSLISPLIIIDLPFSFVLDTVLLPVDGIIYAIDSNNN